MNLPRLPFLALLLVGSALAFAPELQAGASNKNGNPFSANGSYFPNGGTFTAIMRGPNLTGVTQFSTFGGGSDPVFTSGWNMLNGQSANAVSALSLNGGNGYNTNSIPGFVSLYYNGTTFNGPAFSVLNMAANEIASVFYTYNAGGQLFAPGTTLGTSQVFPGGTNGPTVVTLPGVPVNAVQNASTPNSGTNLVTTNTTTTTNSIATAGVQNQSGGSYNYYDGSWTATFQNKYPNQTFNGSGVISLGQPVNPTSPSPLNQANGGPNIVQIGFTVTGTRVNVSQSSIY